MAISPKINFDELGGKSRSGRQSSVAQDLEGVGTVCLSGDCSSVSKTKTSGPGGPLTADVLVHVTTKVDVNNDDDNNKEVPIVVGNRVSGNGITSPPEVYTPSPPEVYVTPSPPPVYVGPSTTDSGFLPQRRTQGLPVFVGSQVKGFSDYQRHLQGFGNFGGFGRPNFYSVQRQGFGHRNPVEFTKTYPVDFTKTFPALSSPGSSGWVPMVWSGRTPQVNPYVPSTIGPQNCVCSNPAINSYQPTYHAPVGRSYFPSNVYSSTGIPGISDKVASLN